MTAARGRPRGKRLRLDPYAMVRMPLRQHAKRIGVSVRTLQYRFRHYGSQDQRTWARGNNRYVMVRDPDGVSRTIADHARHYDLAEGTLRSRGQRYGWDDQRTWYRGRISTGGYGGGVIDPVAEKQHPIKKATRPAKKPRRRTKAEDRELAAAELRALAESAGFGKHLR